MPGGSGLHLVGIMFDASSLGGLSGGGSGRTATSSAPTTISPVYGVSGGNLAWIVGGVAAAVGLVLVIAFLFSSPKK
jgi:hypothetical protein